MQTVAALETRPQSIAQQSSSGECPACNGRGAKPFLRSRDYFFLREALYTVVRCPDCHLGWLENAPQAEEMSSHYGNDYDEVITAPGDLYPHHWDVVRNKLLQYVQGGSILDLGCSSGSFLRSLKGQGWKRYGIEMSKAVAEQARVSAGAEVFVGDVLDASYAENTFDAVTAFHVMEHMYNPREVMAKVLSWLKPGGVFTITLPNIDSLEARIFGGYWFGLDVPRHLWQFSPRALAAMAASVGLEVVEVGTTRSCYLDNSIRNGIAEWKLRHGISAMPNCKRKSPSLGIRLMQKVFRLSVVYPFREIAVAVGTGADLHAVFRKPESSSKLTELKSASVGR
ncbi:MAG TPA: class I SAM-dependent methyltransferase [Terriglobales bacterium]|nr:class I SAM-dependent methyltransferase [Terriglobales bacterium]